MSKHVPYLPMILRNGLHGLETLVNLINKSSHITYIMLRPIPKLSIKSTSISHLKMVCKCLIVFLISAIISFESSSESHNPSMLISGPLIFLRHLSLRVLNDP